MEKLLSEMKKCRKLEKRCFSSKVVKAPEKELRSFFVFFNLSFGRAHFGAFINIIC